MNAPENLRYTKNHEWISVEGDMASIGITDYAQHELGDIVYLDINTVGQVVEQDKVIGSIEAVKTVSDIYSPVSGTVMEVNALLDKSPEKVNTSPYEEGWIAKIKISKPDELSGLLSAAEYKKQVGS